MLRCPDCKSTNIVKAGKPQGKQRYRCQDCGLYTIYINGKKRKGFYKNKVKK
jgi:transposase-like protein